MSTYVALLRGINLGGRNKLPMKDLAKICTAAGCTEVRTYIQSGNVLFDAPAADAAEIGERIQDAVQVTFCLFAPVVVRSARELRAILKANPFVDGQESPQALHVAFLSKKPSASSIAELDRGRSPPDEFVVLKKEIYLRCPNGVARTKLTNAYFDKKLGLTSTMRNWRTVTKLCELL